MPDFVSKEICKLRHESENEIRGVLRKDIEIIKGDLKSDIEDVRTKLEKIERLVDAQFSSLYKILFMLLGTTILSLILLVFNILKKGGN